jgi:hypothetical protein
MPVRTDSDPTDSISGAHGYWYIEGISSKLTVESHATR